MGMEKKLETNQFCITVDYDKNASKPEQIFLGIAKLIEGFQYTDRELVGCIAKEIEPVIMLDDVEQGSIRMILRSVIESLPDEGLERCDVKRIIGTFLVKAKYAILKAMDKKGSISEQAFDALELEISKQAQETGVSALGCYTEPKRETLITSMALISDGVSKMRETDRVQFGADIGNQLQAIQIGRELDIDEEVTNSVTQEEITNIQVVILKIQKVDFIGNSKWEFRIGKNKISAHIEDEAWLEQYKAGKITLIPGDSLKVEMRETMQYAKNHELICSVSQIIKVLSVIHEEKQPSSQLFL